MRGLPDEGFDEGVDGAGACLWPSEQTTAEVYIYICFETYIRPSAMMKL